MVGVLHAYGEKMASTNISLFKPLISSTQAGKVGIFLYSHYHRRKQTKVDFERF
jgi:hypothetical protein